MNHFIVSARKYRPATFDTVVGQQHVTNTLKNAIRSHHVAQAFLFCGPRGVGKTTCARILAKTLNCHNLTDATEACNECESCKSFNSGQSLNIYELDAASNNSVDDIRALVEQVRYAPHSGEYKIYIIDEVHMLSTQAFNAFLKTLEEPPSYAVFILATTEKHKIIPTILSRCQIFDFNRIEVDDIASHLAFVASKEGVKADADALHIIAQKADGALRDALSIFDQMVSYSGEHITYKDVISNLGILDYDYFFRITDDIKSGNTASVLLTFNELLADGFDGHHFINDLASHFRNLLICQDESTLKLLEVSTNIREKYRLQAKAIPATLLLKLLEICSQCDITYKAALNQRLHVELALIRMTADTAFKEPVQKKPAADKPPVATAPAPAVVPSAAAAEKKNPEGAVKESAAQKTPPAVKEKTQELPPIKPSGTSSGYSSVLKKTSLAHATSVREPIAPEEPKDDPDLPAMPFTEEALVSAWTDFAHKEKAAGKHQLFITLTHRKPVIRDDNVIELEIVNRSQENLLNEEKKALMDYLRSTLNNYRLQIRTVLTEAPREETVYTAKEKYQKMVERNPSLEDLRKQLGLELDL